MKTSGFIIPGLALLFSTAQCFAAEDSNSPDAIRIRITNVSEVPFSEVNVRFPSQTEEYGPLAPGASSEYRDVAVAYRYASVTIVADDHMHRAMAADYMGETRLEAGSYTYTIDLNGGVLSFGFLIDAE